MALSVEQCIDIVQATLPHLGRLRWVDLVQDLTEYIVIPQLFQEEKVQFDGARGINRTVMHRFARNARHTQLWDEDSNAVTNMFTEIEVPWRNTTTSYAFEGREFSMNSQSPEKIVDLIKARRLAAKLDLTELMEETFFGKPEDANDKTTPYGLWYWITKNSTEGFYGGNPAGFPAGRGGLDSNVYTKWRNWTAQYTAVSKADLIYKLRRAMMSTRFKSPVDMPIHRRGPMRRQMLANLSTVLALGDLAQAQNQNLGVDLARYDGEVVINRLPVKYVPYLDSDPTSPVVGIDWSHFYIAFLRGEYMNESPPKPAPRQHRVIEVFIDCTYNFFCDDLRSQFVISK